MEECSLSRFKKLSKEMIDQELNLCRKEFEYIDWLDLYYNFSYSNLLPFLSIFIFFIIIYFIKHICEYLITHNVNELRKYFQLSLVLTSILIIPLQNGVTETMLSILTSKMRQGIDITVGYLLGSGIFNFTIVYAVVLCFCKQKYPQIEYKIFIKDLIFYLISLIVVMIFGIIRKLNLVMILVFIFVYFTYLIVSIIIAKSDKKYDYKELKDQIQTSNDQIEIEQNIFQEQQIQLGNMKYPSSPHVNENYINESNQYQNQEKLYHSFHYQDSNIYNNEAIDKLFQLKEQPFPNYDKKQKFQHKMILKYLIEDINFFNFFMIPLRLVLMITVPFEQNPLMHSFYKYFIILFSFFTIYGCFLNFDDFIQGSIIIGIIYVCFILLLKFNIEVKSKVFLRLLVILTAIAYVRLLSSIMLDCFLYFCFLIGYGQAFMSIFFIPFINSIGDLFSFIAFAKLGLEGLAITSIIPSLLLDLNIDVPINLLISGQRNFKIFHRSQSLKYSLLFYIVAILMLIVISFIILFALNFKLSKVYSYIGIIKYFLIFIISFIIVFIDKEL